jgi:opacity protein-like surface antigen
MLGRQFVGGWLAFAALAILFAAAPARGQSHVSAYQTGPSLWAGAEYADFQAGFPNGSSVRLEGVGGFANFNWSHAIGIEARVRFLDFNSWYGETQQDYLAGPRYTFLRNRKWRPFASFQVGMVKIQYPFGMGSGTSFAMAPGGGLEYRLSRRLAARASYEYQILPNSPDFSDEPNFGIRPNGFVAGFSYRIR